MKTTTVCSSDVCAIIVTYHPEKYFRNRLSSILEQVGAVIIVDNGSNKAELSMLRIAAESSSATILISNADNYGIAKALNIGIQQAEALGYKWVLLLDQDSYVNAGSVKTLCEVYESCNDREKIAIIGLGCKDLRKSALDSNKKTLGESASWAEVESVITSGSLLPVSIFNKIGPFREDFFIDFVDIEYCKRARANGYCIINSNKPLMLHAIGEPTKHKFFGMTKWTTNHSADRRYYYARNYTVLCREYGKGIWGWWAIKGLIGCIQPTKRVMLFENNKLSKIQAIAQGWWHGLIGKMGKRDK